MAGTTDARAQVKTEDDLLIAEQFAGWPDGEERDRAIRELRQSLREADEGKFASWEGLPSPSEVRAMLGDE